MSTQKRVLPKPGAVESYPVLPLRDIVVFPHMIVPLFVGREKSIRALEETMKSESHILLATQMNAADDDPATDAIFGVGTLATVLQLLKLPDGTVKVLVEGVARASVGDYVRTDEYYEAKASVVADEAGERVEVEALALRDAHQLRERIVHAGNRDAGRIRTPRHAAQRFDVRHSLSRHQHAADVRRSAFLAAHQRSRRHHHQHR